MYFNISNGADHAYSCLFYNWQHQWMETNHGAIITIAILDCLLSFMAIVVNGVVIVTISRTSTLHSPPNVLVGALAMSDLGNGLITQPSQVIQIMASVNGNICVAGTAFLVLNMSGAIFTLMSLFTLTVIAAERYCAVQFHLRYNEKVTTSRVIVLLVFGWIILPPVILLVLIEQFKADDFLILHSSAIMIGLFITCTCYCKVSIVVRRHFKQIIAQLPPQATEQKVIVRARCKRKFRTVMYIVGAFVLCYLPYSLAVLAGLRGIGRMILLTCCVGGNSCINPLLFFWRISELREAAKRSIAVGAMGNCCRERR